MFSLKLIIYLNLLSIIIAQYDYNNRQVSKLYDDTEIIIDPVELPPLRSTDTEGIYYCNGRVQLSKQEQKLLVSIERPIVTSPKFVLETEQVNLTTIRIRIKPNGYIGVNRINCHWENNITHGQLADLIIGDNPGVIQLKEHCLAYDRRYVECIFYAPNIARAFLNGFPRLYKFTQLNEEPISYNLPPVLVNVTNEGELIFHSEPRDQNIIPKRIFMMVNITLSRFGSSVYRFNIDPVHTTKVNYRIEDISHKRLTIRTMNERLCSGHVSQINDKKTLTAVQDIAETTNQKIVIKGLRSLTEYQICLRCFYTKTDQSFKEEKCERIITNTSKYGVWLGVSITTLIIIASISLIFVLVLVYRRRSVRRDGQTRVPHKLIPSNSTSAKTSDSSIINLGVRFKNMERSYTRTPTHSRSSIEGETDDPLLPPQEIPHNDQYQDVLVAMDELTNDDKVALDTYDVPKQITT